MQWDQERLDLLFAEAMERRWWIKGFIVGGFTVGAIVVGLSLWLGK